MDFSCKLVIAPLPPQGRIRENYQGKRVKEFEEFLCVLYFIRKDEALLEKMGKIIQDESWRKKISVELMLNEMEHRKIRQLTLSSRKKRRENSTPLKP